MDAKIYTELLQKPGKISPDQVQQLNEILRDHPYCKSASILYFVGLHQHNKKAFDERLSHSMIFGDDKRLLNWVIQSLEDETNAVPVVQKEILPQEEEKKAEPPAKIETKVVEEKKAPETEEDKNAKLKEIVAKRIAAIKKEKEPAEIKPEVKTAKAKTTEKVAEKKEIKDKPKKPQGKDKTALINKFIEEEPSIARPTGDYKHNIDLANKSSRDDDNITSETLAQIHLNQGNRKRAIAIYEKLILKYPEKSSYFAALIEKIQK